MQHVYILMSQKNYTLAERELRRVLALEPEYALAHSLLSICLCNLDRHQEAVQEAQAAIGLEPEQDLAHFVLARAWHELDDNRRARKAIDEALRLNPEDADYFGLLCTIHLSEHRWEEALQAAEQGLAHDPEHINCRNLRVRALVKLGRGKEADDGLKDTLAQDPDDSFTHANLGWTLLERGDHRKAFEHLREALRLNPDSEYAREGILQAMRARSIPYRLMLRYSFWLSSKSKSTIWGIILGMYILYQLCLHVSANNPVLAPWLKPLQYAYMIFALSTWLLRPLHNVTLFLDSFGRLVLNRREKIEAACFATAMAVTIPCFILYLVTNATGWILLTWVWLGLALASAGVGQQSNLQRLRLFAGYAGILAALGLATTLSLFLGSLWVEFLFFSFIGCLIGFEVLIIFDIPLFPKMKPAQRLALFMGIALTLSFGLAWRSHRPKMEPQSAKPILSNDSPKATGPSSRGTVD